MSYVGGMIVCAFYVYSYTRSDECVCVGKPESQFDIEFNQYLCYDDNGAPAGHPPLLHTLRLAG